MISSPPPPFGQVQPVAPGVLWLRMPLPFALNHVNLWLLEDGDGWVVVDTGVADATTRTLWQGVFDGVMAGRPPTRLVVTHFHPDHMGLAAWLQHRHGLALETSLAEWLYGRMLSLDASEALTTASLAFYQRAGLGAAQLELVRRRGNAYAARTPHIPTSCRRLRDGDRLRIGGSDWQVMAGHGHSPEMVCLFCADRGLLISGDQILPSISPNVSVWPNEPEADPLTLFLASLDDFRRLPEETLVLPSHGAPFVGLHQRIDVLKDHHVERLQETLEACQEPISAAALLGRLFQRPLDDHQLFFALGESLAHLHHLRSRGEILEDESGGVCRFRRHC